jgi:photosystem II stability/assembly factor-like uncharacterized protein
VTFSIARFQCALAALVVWVTPLGAERWQVQYFYDRNKSSLAIADLSFASAVRGVAVGSIHEGGRQRPVALVTSDGGAHWQLLPLKEEPLSLFFLNENIGWMVTEKGLWQTTEAGKSWTKMPRVPAQILRVYFKDEKNGWAAGARKTVLETHDGARQWTRVAAAAEQPGTVERSAYVWIAFATPQLGVIAGLNRPPEQTFPPALPEWIDPQAALHRRELPHLTLELETSDGGKTWKSASASIFGQVTRIRFGPPGVGLGLIEYSDTFQFPSEAYRLNWPTGSSERVYRDKNFAVTDVYVTPDGTGYLSGIVVSGELRSLIPGRVRVLKSRDFSTWTDIEVDYRAVANRTIMAAAGDRDIWLATDSGMILKLTQ